MTDAPALNIEVAFNLIPPMLARGKQTVNTFRRGTIDRLTPFILGFTYVNHNTKTWMTQVEEIVITVKYNDLLGRNYELQRTLDSTTELEAPPPDIVPLERIAQSIAEIRELIEMAAKNASPAQPTASRSPTR